MIAFLLLLILPRTYGECGDGSSVQRGKKTDVCVVIAKRLDWRSTDQQYVRSAFQVEVDEFAQIRWPGITSQNSTDLVVSVHAGDHASYQKYYRTRLSKHGKVIFPILSVVIKVHQGDIRQILWDDLCFHSDDGCIDNTFDYKGNDVDGNDDETGLKQSYIDASYCEDAVANHKNEPICQLRIFISWIGTDVNGDVLLSQQFRFSRFDTDLLDTYVKDDLETT